MTGVWSIIVACLVAFGGVGRGEPRGEPAVAMATSGKATIAVVHTVAARSASHIAAQRGRGLERRLPLATLPAALSLHTPSLRSLVQPCLAVRGAAVRRIATGSARGPPIA